MIKNYYHVTNVKCGWRKIPHAVFYDEDLTSDAKVVISELLSVSGEFHISEASIAKSLHLSLERTKKAIKLLKSSGYIQITHVKNGTQFGGCYWGISDTRGNFQQTENHASGNPATENAINHGKNPSRRKTILVETRQAENPSKYIKTERFQKQNYQEEEIQRQNHQDEERENEEALSLASLTPSKRESSMVSSSEAKASPHSSKIPHSGGSLITQKDLTVNQAFDKFCEVYPNLADKYAAREAFLAIPDISNLCWQIVQSVEWFEKNGKWDNWHTGQKNVSCPQATKFLKRGDWEQYLKTGREETIPERMARIRKQMEESGNETNGFDL